MLLRFAQVSGRPWAEDSDKLVIVGDSIVPKTKTSKNYKFIKITNNNVPEHFIIDCTVMSDSRLRISALKAQYKRYLIDGLNKKPVYDFFKLDYSFCVVHSGEYSDYSEVKKKRAELVLEYLAKIPKSTPLTNLKHSVVFNE